MPFVAAPNIVQAEWRCLRNGQRIENRMMIDMLGDPTLTQMNELRVVLWDWWENVHATVLHLEVNLREVVLTNMGEQNGEQVTYAPDTTTTGTISGTAMPNEVSCCVSLRTGVRGRSARGRWYTCSVASTQMADTNNMTSAATSGFASTLQQLLTAITGEGFVPVIVSYISGGVPRPGGPVYFPISSAVVVDTLVDSMKRRKPGVGT